MSPRQYLAGAASLIAITAALALMAPACTQTRTPESGKQLLRGTPLQPDLAEAEAADQINRSNYRSECLSQLAARRLWATPIAVIAVFVAICSYRRVPPQGFPTS
ncbi:hypothetical protein [Mycobacteroides abscessus]